MKRLKSVHLVYDIDDGNACYTNTLAYDGDKYDDNEAIMNDIKNDVDSIVARQLEENDD